METPSKLPRPPQVTLVGWLIVVGSVLVVFNAYETFTSVRSLETREAVTEYLEGRGASLGWSVEQGVAGIRTAALVTAVCAAASAVLGFFALRRDRGARIGLAVLVLPLFVSGVLAGGFLSSMVAAGAVLLWMQPARDWFNGKPMATPVQRTGLFGNGPGADARERQQTQPPVPAPPSVSGGTSQAGRPVQGFGDRPTWEKPDPYAGPQPYGAPVEPGAPGVPGAQVAGPYAPGPRTPVGRRPRAVVWAVVLTLVFAGFTLLSALASLAVGLASPDTLVDEFLAQQPELVEQGVTPEQVRTTMLFTGGVMALLSFCAVAAALLVLFRRAGGWPILVLIASGSAFFCLLATTVAPPMLVPGIASATVVMLLLRPETKAWLKDA